MIAFIGALLLAVILGYRRWHGAHQHLFEQWLYTPDSVAYEVMAWRAKLQEDFLRGRQLEELRLMDQHREQLDRLRIEEQALHERMLHGRIDSVAFRREMVRIEQSMQETFEANHLELEFFRTWSSSTDAVELYKKICAVTANQQST